jgi:hypothetical protein
VIASSNLSGAALAQLPQELIEGNKEWVLLENSPNDDHRMGAHNVNDDTPAKLGEVVGLYDQVDWALLAKPYIVCHLEPARRETGTSDTPHRIVAGAPLPDLALQKREDVTKCPLTSLDLRDELRLSNPNQGRLPSIDPYIQAIVD